MQFRSLAKVSMFVLLSAALAACHDSGKSGGDEAEELTGVFQAGGVSGVSYQTPTRQGATDAAGTFRYLPGETVTFSIGGTELGSAPGAAAITPFTLAGMTPPTTELALRRELDRTRRMATPLARAMNIAMLLLALDADRDPANGIAVGSRVAALANVSLDVEQGIGPFLSAMYKNIPGLTANIPPSQALAHLYRAVNVTVPAHVSTRSETTTTAAYVIQPLVRNATYSPEGLMLTATADSNNDGQPESRAEWTYDARGRVIGFSNWNTPSIFGSVTRNTTQLDASGYRTGTTTERDYDGDGVYEAREVTDFENDAHGFVIRAQSESDGDGDGELDSRVIQGYAYDARHNVTGSTFESDNDLDGVSDERSVIERSFDAQDRPMRSTDSYDEGADGTVDFRYVTDYQYGSGRGATREVTSFDEDNDGDFDSQTVTTRTFNSAGDLLLQVQASDDDLDGTVDGTWRNEATFDDRRHPLSQSLEIYDADGVLQLWQRTSSSFDDAGNILEATLEQGSAGFSALNTSSTSRYEYGASGEVLVTTSEVSLNGQSPPFQNTTTTVTSTVLSDGVLALGQQYFEYLGSLLNNYVDGGVIGFPVDPFVTAN